ncbi:hypothetical protein SASPL_113897 [Salvia splendens]|uniref:Uncharacterized protein n=1 Tax=Salvia splendens TaxID=180675 RepID=A0A8X8Y4I9_SALSN|nr:hypothetical protein SASPL_113897 [Salvia splendens]
MSIPPLSDFFYKGKWSPACDGVLVDCLIMLKGETQWSKSVVPSWFLPTAAEWMKDKASVIFSELELKDGVDLLRKRYYTFKVVLRIQGAYLDAPMKVVVAPADSWEKMLKMNAYAICRKLFDEDAEPNDRESATEDGDYLIDLGSDGYMRYREEKGRMLPKPPGPSHEVGGPSALKSPHASSCGSNSSMKWWPHNVKRP